MSEPAIITMILQFKPELVDEICAGFPQVAEETRRMKGFRDLRMRRHAKDPGKVLIIEEWDTQEDYQAYLDWRMASDGGAAFAATLDAPPQRDFWPTKVI